MPAPRRNVEVKATDPDPERSAGVCRALGAAPQGVIAQRDTYFHVDRGWLKLREELPGRPHLIQYERDDDLSRYRVIEVDDGATVLAALTIALGIRGQVVKRRRLFLWQDVRIHLDDVEELGSFIELEAVAPPESDLGREHRLVAELREAFAITDDRLCSSGYAALLGA